MADYGVVEATAATVSIGSSDSIPVDVIANRDVEKRKYAAGNVLRFS